jgi:hypothetical protein
MRRPLIAVVALFTLAHLGSATAEDDGAYKYDSTEVWSDISWYSPEPYSFGYLTIYASDSASWGSYGSIDFSYEDEGGWGLVSCAFPTEALVVNDHGNQLESAVLAIDSTEEGVFCYPEPMQVQIVLTATPDTHGLFHGNGTEKIQGHVRMIQTIERFWGVTAQGYIGERDIPPDAWGRLEVKTRYEVTR